MRKEVMILIFALILIVGSASVYAAGEPIGVPSAPSPPPAPAQETPAPETTVQIMQIKPQYQGSTIFVYDSSAQKVDRYLETEKGKLKYVDSTSYTLEKWRELAGTGDPDYLSNPMTPEEARTELVKRGATPKPQITPAPTPQQEVQAMIQAPQQPAPAAPETKAEPKKEQAPAETKHQDKTGSEVKTESAKPDKLRELVIAKAGTQQELAAARQEYEQTSNEKASLEEKWPAALARYEANKNDPEAQKEINALGAAILAAREKETKARIRIDDAEISLKQKETALAEEYAAREKGQPVAQARGRVAAYQALIEKQDTNAKEQEASQKKIDSLEEYISGLEGEEGKEEELKKAKDNLEIEEKNLAAKKTEAKGIKEDIAKQKPITNLDSADVRLVEIDREINELNVRTTAAAEQEYKRIQNERIDAEKDIKNELEAPEIKSEYDKIKAIPEKDRTPAQQEAIENYEYKLEEYTSALKDWTAQEAKAKAEYEAKQKEAKEKTGDLNKEKAEVQDAKATYKLQQEIAELDKTLAKDKAALAKAITDKNEEEIKRLEKKIKQDEAKKAKKQDDLLWKERNWGARAVFLISSFMQGYEEYKGIGQWSSLVLGDEDLAKRRQKAAEKFCKDIWYLASTKCWQSRLCEQWYLKDPPAAQNSLVTEIGIGGYLPAASIQAEKSFPMMYMEAGKTKTQRTYKITYLLENPLDEWLTYHIELRGDRTFKSEEGRLTRRYMEEGKTIAGGRTGRLGSDPLIFESDYNYNTACIVFSPRIENARGGYENEICSPIIQYGGAATKPYTLPAGTQANIQNATGTSTGVSMTGA